MVQKRKAEGKTADKEKSTAKSRPSVAQKPVAQKSAAQQKPVSQKSATKKLVSQKPVPKATSQKFNAKKAGEQKATSQKQVGKKTTRKKPSKRKWPWVIVGIVVACLLVAASLFSWNRWLRFDDAYDMQDTWLDVPTGMEVVIDEKQIGLTEEVSYVYTLDTWNKSITFTFGDLEGQGTYRFSDDRNMLYIVEGETTDLFADIARLLGIAEEPNYQNKEGATVLTRLSAQ